MVSPDSPAKLELTRRRLPRWWRGAAVFARQVNLFLWLEIAAAIALVTMLVSSWVTLSGGGQPNQMVPSGKTALLLVGTLIPAMSLLVLFGRRLAIRRAGGTTARLHVNLVFFFSLVAAIPTLLVAIFASFLFQSGAEFWFSDNQRGILENANRLAQGYYDQNQREVAGETVAMASDLRYVLQQAPMTSEVFQTQYFLQIYSRGLTESAILRRQGAKWVVLAVANPDNSTSKDRISEEVIATLRAGEPAVATASKDRIEAISPLDLKQGIYLYNARKSDARATQQWNRAQSVVQAYDVLTRRARVLQLRFNLALFGVSLSLVGLAVWFALRFADRQVKPLADLVTAAREVGSGNYALRVTGRTGPDEIGLLNRAFNRMTEQIERQTDALLGANHQLAERRAFIEAVLQSITAGIVSVDAGGTVQLMNASGEALLLESGEASPLGRPLQDVAPQLARLLDNGSTNGIVQYGRSGELLTLAVKVAPAASGHVITFEDITRQLLDQRQAAWSDVARRIAHEIKNPLTPIQLATERLKRRYRKQILEDGDLFEELTGTIIRQVGSLRQMVDEFSSFARLPKPVFRQEDAVDLVRQAMFLQEVGHPQINYILDAAAPQPHIDCDRHQFGQAMTNVLKNAAEAVDARQRAADVDFRGRIDVAVAADDHALTVTVTDNGVGLPDKGERIIEPYVTTREKGTGLGLAIVKKIVEEHGGDLSIAGADNGGARVTLRFARTPQAVSDTPDRGSEAAE